MKSMQRSPKRQRISFDGRLYPHATSARAELTDSCRVLEFPQVVTPEAQHRNDRSLPHRSFRYPAVMSRYRTAQGLAFLPPAWSAPLVQRLGHGHQLVPGAALVALLSAFGAGFVVAF